MGMVLEMFKLKSMALIAIISLFTVFLAGCGSSSSEKTMVDGKINVVTSFYPLYDFTRKIGGDHVNAINLVPAGVEPHDWSPKSKDMSNMTNAQLFVYQGAGFEGWVHDFLDSLKSDSSVKVVEASKGANLIKASSEDGHDHGHAVDGHSEPASSSSSKGEEALYDPHLWLSPTNAKIMAQNIKESLIEVDPAHKAEYEQNYEKLAAQLTDLDARFKQELSKTTKKEIAVSHQAFGYLCHDYGLTQMPIMGMSPDSEPTAKDLQQIQAFIKEHNVKYIFFEELVSDKLAKTLAKDAKVDTMVLNPLEGLTEAQLNAGEDYLSVMDSNLKNLLKALQ
jgi:zinc transport system substrate-binding protein